MQKKAKNLMVVEQYKQEGYEGLLPLLREHSNSLSEANAFLRNHKARLGLSSRSKFHSADYPEVAEYIATPYAPEKVLRLHHHLFKDTVDIQADDIVVVSGSYKPVLPLLISPKGQQRLNVYFDSLKDKKPDSDLYLERKGELEKKKPDRPRLPLGRPPVKKAAAVQQYGKPEPLALVLFNSMHDERARDRTVNLIEQLLDAAQKSDRPDFIFQRIVSLKVGDFKHEDGTLFVSGDSAAELVRYFQNKNLSLPHF